MRYSDLKPNLLLAYSTAMATPWLFLGLNFSGYSLLLSLFIPLLDLFYWLNFAASGFRDKPQRYLVLSVFTLLICWVGWQSPTPLRLFLKFGLITLFIKYVISILQIYGPKPFTYAYRLACLITILQFITVNFIDGTYLFDPKSLIFKITPSLTIGTGIDAGQYFGVHLWPNLARVGGTALEPGHMALIAAVFAPFLLKTFPDRLILAGAILASLSKVSFFQLLIILWGWMAVYIIRAGMLWLSIMLAYIGATYLLLANYFSSAKALFSFNPSVYERLQGAILFLNSELKFKLLGHGYLGVCEYVNPNDIVSEHVTGYSELVTGGSICTLGVHSLFGSFLVEAGLLGVLIVAFGLTMLETRKVRSFGITNMRPQMVVVIIFCGLTSVHWLTNLPPVYVAAALLFAEVRGQSYAK